jgi:hypothetical protein
MNLSRRLADLERQARRRTAKPTAPAVPFDYERFAELCRAGFRQMFRPRLDPAEKARRWQSVLRFYGKADGGE